MRELGPFVLLLCACGAAVRATSPPPQPDHTAANAPAASPSGDASSAAGAEAAAAFDAIAARAASLAPGMREVARKDGGAEPVDLVKAETRDVCVRVAWEATGPVVAKLVERSGSVLASTESPATAGVLGLRGPVCVRRGDVVRGLVEGAGARVRWVAWQAP